MNNVTSTITRSPLGRGIVLLSVMTVLAVLSTIWIVTGASQTVILGGVGIVLLWVAMAILQDWRLGVFVFIGWLLFEDLARKYSGNNVLLFFGKDVLAAVTYISYLSARQRRQVVPFRAPFFAAIAMFFGLAVAQVLNPGSPSVLYGLLGLKLYFFYVPMMYLGYNLLHDGMDLEKFLLFNLALGMVIAILGVAQSILGLSFLNPVDIAPELQSLTMLVRRSSSGQYVPAVSSVFVSAGRFAWYIIVLVILAMGTQAYLMLRRRRAALWGLIGLGVALVAAMQSGSRGSIAYSAISILVLSAGFLWGTPWNWAQGRRLVKSVRTVLLVGAAGLFLMVLVFPEAIGASYSFYSDTLSPTSEKSELATRAWSYPIAGLETSFVNSRWIYGQGTGTASLGLQYIANLFGQSVPDASGESGFGTLVTEMGIFGLVLWIVMAGTLLWHSWKMVLQVRQTVYFPIALAIFWYAFLLLLPFTYMGTAYQNYVMNAYLWLLIGVLFRIPHLARAKETVPAARIGVPQMARVPVFSGGR